MEGIFERSKDGTTFSRLRYVKCNVRLYEDSQTFLFGVLSFLCPAVRAVFVAALDGAGVLTFPFFGGFLTRK